MQGEVDVDLRDDGVLFVFFWFFGFERGCLYVWSQMYQVSLEVFDHMEMKLTELKHREKESGRGWRGRGLGLSCFVKDIECNGIPKWKGRKEKKRKREKENEKERIFESILVEREKKRLNWLKNYPSLF